MATKIGEVYYDIGAKLDKFNSDLEKAKEKATGLGREFDKAAAKLEKTANKMKAVGKKMTTFITLPLIAAVGASIKLSSNLEESLNKVNVAFGGSAEEIEDWSKTTLKAFGISRGSALDMAALYGDMSTSMGITNQQATEMSKTLVGLAGDMASFKNISLDRANTALKGIYTGEGEALKSLGVVMLDATLETFAMEKGIKKNYKTMSQAEKVLLRYQFVLEKTKNSQGDFKNTSSGAANQMKIFSETLKEVGENFGSVILPFFTEIITKINEFLTWLSELDKSMKNFIVTSILLAAAIGPIVLIIGKMIAAYRVAIIVGTAFKLGMAGQAIATGGSTLALIANRIALTAATIAQKLLNLAMRANPIFIVIGLVVALTAALFGLLQSTEEMTYAEQKSADAKKLLTDLQNGLTKATVAATREVDNYVSALQRHGATSGKILKNLKERNKFLKEQIELTAAGSNRAQIDAASAGAEIAANNKRIRSLQNLLVQTKTTQKQSASKDYLKARNKFENDWTKKLAEHGKTRSELLVMQRDEALLEADKFGSKRAAISKFYDEEITRAQFEELKKTATMYVDAFTKIGSAIKDLYTAFGATREQDINDRYDKLTSAEVEYNAFLAEKEKERYDGLSESEKREYDLRVKADESRVKQEKKKAKELKKLHQEQAIVQKIAALFSIAADAAKGIMSAIAAFWFTGGQPWVSIIGATAALQAAAVLAAPLPKAKDGIFADSPYIGGEAGPELAFPLASSQGQKAMELFAGKLIGEISARENVSPATTNTTINEIATVAPTETGSPLHLVVNIGEDKIYDNISDAINNRQIIIDV